MVEMDNNDTITLVVPGKDVRGLLRLADRYEGSEVTLEYDSVRGKPTTFVGAISAQANTLHVANNDGDKRMVWYDTVRTPRHNSDTGMKVGENAEIAFTVPATE